MAKLGNLYYDISLDDSSLKAALQRVKAELKGLDNELVSLSNFSGGKQLSNAFDVTGKSIEQVKNQMNALVQVYNKLDMGGEASEAEKVRQRWLELQQVLAKYGVTVRNSAMETRTLSQAQSMESKTVEQIVAKMRSLVEVRTRENTTTAQGRQNIAAINVEYQRLNRTLQDLGVKQRNFNDGIFNMGRIANEVKGQIQSVYSIYALERFVSKMIDIRSQFELQQTSLRAILQDKYTADKIFAQVIDLGLKSPFTTMEIDGYVKQLAAYRIETEDLFDTTKRLADVSAGLGVDMQRLILAYGQVRAASVLRGQEVRQFTEAGIPLIEALADKFTELRGTAVSTGEVFDMISKRMVSFGMVKEIFEDLTNAGGMFYNMQEIQSETLYGKVQNLGDAFDLAFNNLGKANDGVLKGSVDLLWKFAENIDVVISALTTLIGLYGVYKIALLATNTLMGQGVIVTYAKSLIDLARNIQTAAVAQNTLNAATRANVYAAVATAVLALGYAIYKYATHVDEATKFTNELNRELTTEADKLNSLFGKLKETTIGTRDRIDAVKELTSKYGSYLKGINLEIMTLEQLAEVQEMVNQKLRDNITLKKLDEEKTNIETKFNEDSKKYGDRLTENLIESYGADVGSRISARFGDALSKLKPGERVDLSKFLKQTYNDFGDKLSGRIKGQILSDLSDLNDAKQDYFKQIKDIEVGANATQDELSKLNPPTKRNILDFSAEGKSVNELEYALEELNQEIKNLGKTPAFEDLGKLVQYTALAQKINNMLPSAERAIDTEDGLNERIKKLAEEKGALPMSSSEHSDYEQRIEYLERKRGKGKYNRDKLAKQAETAQQKADREAAKKTLEAETNSNNELKRKLELVEQVRKAYSDLNSQALALNDNTEEGKRISEESLKNIPSQLQSMFPSGDYKWILDENLFNDDQFKGFLSSMITQVGETRDTVVEKLASLKTDVTDSNKETVANYLVTLTKSLTDVDLEAWWNEYKKVIEQQKEAISARNKLFSEEPPEGTGFAFRLSKIMTDVRNDIVSKNKEITAAMVGATDEQKAKLEELQKAWTDAYDEEGLQKAEKLAQTYFNQALKKQKLDVDMSGLSSATLSQLNRLRDALKEMETEFTGKGLIDMFDAVGLSIEGLKGYIDTTSISSVNKSISDLLAFTPEDIKLTKEQRKALEAISKILGTFEKNNKKGLFDIDLQKFKKFKEIADAIADAFGQIGAALGELGEATVNEGLTSLAQDMQFAAEMAGNISNIAQGIATKDPKQIIQGIAGTISTLIKAEAAYQKARLEFLKQQRKLQTEYNALLIEQIRLQKEGSNGILYDDLVANFKASFDASVEATKQLDALLDRTNIKVNTGRPLMDMFFPTYKSADNIEEYLSSISVQTGVKRKKFLGVTTGSKAVYGDLLEKFPKLIDSSGKLDVEFAKIVVSQNNFKDQGKEALEELIAYTEEYNKAMEEMDSQINSLFGGIGSLISDALISSFHNGTLAADEFFKNVNSGIGDMLDSLVSNLVMTTVFGDMLDEYKEAIKGAILSDDPQKNLTELMGNLVDDVKKGYDDAAGAMKLYDEAKQKAGLGNVNDPTREGLSEAYAKATQASIDVLTGVTYAALEKISQTANNTNAINMNVSAMTAELQTQTAILSLMAEHTANLPYMKSSLDTIINRGVKLQ